MSEVEMYIYFSILSPDLLKHTHSYRQLLMDINEKNTSIYGRIFSMNWWVLDQPVFCRLALQSQVQATAKQFCDPSMSDSPCVRVFSTSWARDHNDFYSKKVVHVMMGCILQMILEVTSQEKKGSISNTNHLNTYDSNLLMIKEIRLSSNLS